MKLRIDIDLDNFSYPTYADRVCHVLRTMLNDSQFRNGIYGSGQRWCGYLDETKTTATVHFLDEDV